MGWKFLRAIQAVPAPLRKLPLEPPPRSLGWKRTGCWTEGVVLLWSVMKQCSFTPAQPITLNGPPRLAEILKQLDLSGLQSTCTQVASREATKEELLRVHTENHIDLVSKSSSVPKKKGKDWGLQPGLLVSVSVLQGLGRLGL